MERILMILPVLTAGIYLFGLSYHQGYLKALGVDETLFALSVDRTLFMGFISIIEMSIKSFFYLAIILAVLVLSSDLVIFVSKSKSASSIVERAMTKLNSACHNNSRAWAQNLSRFLLYTSIYIGSGLILYFLFVIVVIFAEKSGEDRAREFYARKNSSDNVSLYLAESARGIEVGPSLRVIECGSDFCAFLDGNKSVVIRKEMLNGISSHNISLRGGAKAGS